MDHTAADHTTTDYTAARIAQVQSLENGKGLQFLIDEAYKILGNPLVLFNMAYELMFCVKNVNTDDPFWNEIVNNGVFSDESIRFFLEECFIDDVANSKTITLLISEKLKYERLYGRVFNGYHDTVADLVMVACNKPFAAQDERVYEAVCLKLSQEISLSTYYKQYGIRYHDKLIGTLLDTGINDKAIYSGHLSNLYEDMKTNLYVVVAEVGEDRTDPGEDRTDSGEDRTDSGEDRTEPGEDRTDPGEDRTDSGAENALEKHRNTLKEMYPEFKYAVYANHIVIIASNNKSALPINRDLPKLGAYFKAHTIRIGISNYFDNLYSLREYYNQAVESLKKRAR